MEEGKQKGGQEMRRDEQTAHDRQHRNLRLNEKAVAAWSPSELHTLRPGTLIKSSERYSRTIWPTSRPQPGLHARSQGGDIEK